MSRIASAAIGAPRRISAVTGIAQDNIIFAAVLFAFVVWITSKGELSTYIAFFTPGATQGPLTAPITATSSTGASSSSGVPGVPGLSSNPLAGLPSSVGQFFKLPSLNLGSGLFGTGGAANPSTGSNMGLGN